MELTSIVSEKKANQFKKKGIISVEELIRFIPYDYEDLTQETGIRNEGVSCLTVYCSKIEYVSCRNPFIKGSCFYKTRDGWTLPVEVVWFNQSYLYRTIKTIKNEYVYLCGNITYNEKYRVYSCSNPLIFSTDISGSKCIRPKYSDITKMSDAFLTESIVKAMDLVKLKNLHGEDFMKANNLMDINEAYHLIHFPKTMDDVEKGRDRLAYDSVLYYALRLEKDSRMMSKGSQYNIRSLSAYNAILSALPYKLTVDQQNAIDDMISKIRDGRRLNGLLQGDVSCGKSIVAFLLAAAIAGSGFQAAIMAPTQVLARQHYNELSELCKGIEGIKVAYYGGTDMKASERRLILESIKNGNANIIVGTQALISSTVQYANLALTVVDEEHKFGVLQRNALVQKASAGVHAITMSATPIPRSLSQIMYGDNMQLYTIKTMPRGRKPVKSCITNNQDAVFKFLVKQLQAGHQAYVICPMITHNDKKKDMKSVEDTLIFYNQILNKYGFNASALSGKNTKDETNQIIENFKANNTQVLIATTVIEVGVNVPNATLIIIQNSENFGLAQLHQLRGRVGRGADQAYCIFESDQSDNARLNVMVSTTDGFKIAEEDLILRGAGEYLGTRQSGVDEYMNLILSSEKNKILYDQLRELAPQMLDSGEHDQFLSEYNKTDDE